ncbi:phospho-2-dehydro-3-deoxyheptonate aldolase 2, chloroplastic-like [Olea europaea subsp. europaea]|uniref:Phospho-2-dehydro-3-deoxyheptonate aldolase n=1 Tax=Olea europaea subsp. europaea TaxID=158383 RepID=A0A8S0UYQ2_OLEEU|nr:phospho-2-dehydro-3-deoxyheptonate aldolase 2, chloroplastic-like [Olea europaea subsp. europaea]
MHAAEPAKTPIVATKKPAVSPLSSDSKWALESWKTKKVLQLPEYPDAAELESVLKTLEAYPPLVFAGEMSVVLTFGGQMPVVKVGRMAGQFAKPRSEPFEEKDGVKLPSYKGDNINGDAFNEKSIPRLHRPSTFSEPLLLEAFSQGLSDHLRFFVIGIFIRYQELAHSVDEALGFMETAALTIDHPVMSTTEFWTSHECLLLPYVQLLTRKDSTSGLHYGCSAHMLWVGKRTRQLDEMDPNELVNLIEILNPINRPGRITIIVRMCAESIRVKLPHLIRPVCRAGQIVTWAEVRAFFNVHEQEGSYTLVEYIRK